MARRICKASCGCQYQLPKSDAGVVDPNKIAIEYTPGGSGTPQALPRVNDASACGPTGCPATCTAVQSDSNPKVEILLGCLGS